MKKAARGCPRIQIWSHEGPNQSQNHGFESDKKPWFCSSGKQEGQGSKRTRTTPCASETGHFLFFSAKTRTLEKRHAKLMKFCQILMIFGQFFSKFDPKCSGPAFFVESLARPKIWRLVSTKRKILRLVSTRRQVLTDIVKISERVVSDKRRNLRRERAYGPVLFHIDVRTPHARGMFGEQKKMQTHTHTHKHIEVMR